MKAGRPEDESTVVGYPMPLVVAVSFAVELMMTGIEVGWGSPMILILKTVLLFFQQIMPSQGKLV
jgi:hypothetical protein